MKIIAIVLIALVASVGIGSAAPVDVAGFDTPYDRCIIYMDAYEEKLDLLDHYTGRPMGLAAFRDFYYQYYNGLTMKYARMYWRLYGI